MKERTAPVCGCKTSRSLARGMCKRHYDHWKWRTPKSQRPPIRKRQFSDFVDKDSSDAGCWIWTGARDKHGYGRWGGRGLAHRIALLSTSEPSGNANCACHHCDNPPCVNPDHLYWGTPMDNSRDYHRRGKLAKPPPPLATHCHRGHAFTDDNIRPVATPGRPSYRACRKCANERNRLWAAAQRKKARGD